jgi:Anti-sigma factor NepR
MHDDEDEISRSPPEDLFRTGIGPPSDAKLDRAIQERLGRELRQLYEEILNEPLPERLLALLEAQGTLH